MSQFQTHLVLEIDLYFRLILYWKRLQITGQNLRHIGEHFTNIASSGVSQMHRRIKQKMSNNAKLANEISYLKDKLMLGV